MKSKYILISSLITIISIGGYFLFDRINFTEEQKPLLKVKLYKEMIENQKHFTFATLQEALEENYNVKFVTKDYDLILDGVAYHSMDNIDQKLLNDKAVKIQYTWEAENPHFELYDLIIGFDIVDHPKYFRVPLYHLWFTDKISQNYKRQQCAPSQKKYFACMLNSNPGLGIHPLLKKEWDGIKSRTRLFHKLSLYKYVASAGKYLNNIGEIVKCDDTLTWLSQCKFVIAYENIPHPGYITEKAPQAYFANSIPIYDGHPSVIDDINENAIIYSGNFADEDALIEYIKKVDNDDELYCKIWDQQLFNKEGNYYDDVKTRLSQKLKEVIDAKLKEKKK